MQDLGNGNLFTLLHMNIGLYFNLRRYTNNTAKSKDHFSGTS